MEKSIKKLDDSEFRNAFSRSYILVKEYDHKRDSSRRPSHGRSRSSGRSYRHSQSQSPSNGRGRSKSPRTKSSRHSPAKSPSKSASRSRCRSRSPPRLGLQLHASEFKWISNSNSSMEELQRSSILKFYSDQQLCYADILSPSQVRARIEVTVLNFLKILTSSKPAISDLLLVNRSHANSRVNQGLLTEVSTIFLCQSVCTRSLMKPNAAKSFVRVWKLMEMCYKILVQEKRVTQRELYYKLLCDSPHLFTSQLEDLCQCSMCKIKPDVVALLLCSRYSLGIMASSRGLLAGRIVLQKPNHEEVVDCSARGSSGQSISGDLSLLENLILKTDARYVIVVEKHAIFQRLAEDRFFNQVPSILITARGYPDIATRNPAGVSILCTYKYGSIGMGLEAYRYSCNVKWLGLRGDDLHLIPQQSLIPLKIRDHQIAKSLMSSDLLQEPYSLELASMVQSGKKAEIEALYFHGFDYLGKFIAEKIVQGNYL